MATLNEVAALARDAAMSTSYKPALLKALVRIVRADARSEIELIRIGEEFVSLYWVQTVIFRLRQAATITAEPEVVRRIRTVAETSNIRELAALAPELRARLNREMASVLKINVLAAFHRSKPVAMTPLFAWNPGENFISLTDDALAFIVQNGHALETIANHWWARYLERVNMLAPLIIEKVERNGAQRGSIAKYLKILMQIDGPTCFYCERTFNKVTPHIDHVIPWSFLLSDFLWDLVLACAHCNLAKSDRLPERSFLEKLANRGVMRSKVTLPVGFASPLIARADLDHFFDAALSVEWPSGWAP